MELDVNKIYRIVTIPLNWVIQKKENNQWGNETYWNTLEQLFTHLRSVGIKQKRLTRLREQIQTILNINESQTSALFLTRKKHPHFSKKVGERSLQNLRRGNN